MKSRLQIPSTVLVFAAVVALSACVNVKKGENGDNVDVKTPFG